MRNGVAGCAAIPDWSQDEIQTHPVVGAKYATPGTHPQTLEAPEVAVHGVKLKGTFVAGGLFSSNYRKPTPSNQYVKALVKVISENDVKSGLSEMVNSRFR